MSKQQQIPWSTRTQSTISSTNEFGEEQEKIIEAAAFHSSSSISIFDHSAQCGGTSNNMLTNSIPLKVSVESEEKNENENANVPSSSSHENEEEHQQQYRQIARAQHPTLIPIASIPCSSSSSTATTEREQEEEEKQIPIKKVVFSPNGKYIAAIGDDTCIRLIDAETGEVKIATKNHKINKEKNFFISALCFTPDSNILITGSIDGSIVFTSVITGKKLHEIRLKDIEVVVGDDDENNDVEEKIISKKKKKKKKITTSAFVTDLDISEFGDYLAVSYSSIGVLLFDLVKIRTTIFQHPKHRGREKIENDSSYSLFHNDFYVFDAIPLQVLTEKEEKEEESVSFCFQDVNNNGKKIPKSLLVNLVSTCVKFSPSGQKIIEGRGCYVLMWDLFHHVSGNNSNNNNNNNNNQKNKPLFSIFLEKVFTSRQYSVKNEKIVTSVHQLQLQQQQMFQHHPLAAASAETSEKQEKEEEISIITPEQQDDYQSTMRHIFHFSFDETNSVIACSSLANNIKIFNLKSGKEVTCQTHNNNDKKKRKKKKKSSSTTEYDDEEKEEEEEILLKQNTRLLNGHESHFCHFLSNTNNNTKSMRGLLTASTDGKLRFWDFNLPTKISHRNFGMNAEESKNFKKEEKRTQKFVSSAAPVFGGGRLPSIEEVRNFYESQLDNNHESVILAKFSSKIWSCCLSPDNHRLAVACSDGSVHLFELFFGSETNIDLNYDDKIYRGVANAAAAASSASNELMGNKSKIKEMEFSSSSKIKNNELSLHVLVSSSFPGKNKKFDNNEETKVIKVFY